MSGDLLIAHIGGGTAPETPPTGFTLIDENTTGAGSDPISSLYWKIAGGSEPASYDWGNAGSPNSRIGAMVRISGAHQTAPIEANSIKLNAADTTALGTAITQSTTDALIMLFTITDGNPTFSAATIATSPPSFTEKYENSVGGGDPWAQSMSYAVRTTIGSTGAASVTLSASEENIMHVIAVRPPGITVSATAISLVKTMGTLAIIASQTFVASVIALTKTVPNVTATTDEQPAWTNTAKSATATFTNTAKF